LLAAAGSGYAQAPWHEDFEGPTPSWQTAGGNAQANVQQHQRVAGMAHGGRGCEWFQISAQRGTAVYVAHDVGRPWVIEELRPSAWVKSDRGGLQFLAEVTLPRTSDPRTGQPLTTLLFGSTYTDIGRWQQLGIDAIPRLLARQVQMLRSQLTTDVDPHEAYVSRVLLNVYGGPGVTNVWIDDLEVSGHVGSAPAAPPSAVRPEARPVATTQVQPNVPAPPEQEVKLTGPALLVDGNPMFSRGIQYQGERLATLKQLGFNTVWLKQMPPVEMLNDAKRLGLWLICPPPVPPPDQPPVGGPIGPEFDPVLAWDLGTGLAGEQLDVHRRWADAIRMADVKRRRPLIGSPVSDLRGYSRVVNLLLSDRRPLGTSLEMPDYGIWIRRQPLLALPGTPIWATIQTQLGETLRRQLAALLPGRPLPSTVSLEQVRLLVYTAISSGSRGLMFLSQSSLEADDPDTRQRATTCQLINLELEVIEPWIAGGSNVALAESNQRLVTGAVLRCDRARIVLPIWMAFGSQCVAPLAAANPLSLIVPSVPESSRAYELTAGRLQPLRHKRDTGGMRLTLEEFGLSALLFTAQDPLIIDAVTRRASANGRLSVELERQLTARKLETTGALIGQLANRMPPKLNVAEQLAAARQDLQSCDARLAAGDLPDASLHARRAMRPLRFLQRTAWETAVASRDSPVASPGTTGFAMLPWHWALMDRLAASRPGPTLLPGGDFEDFNVMLRSGWRTFQHATEGVQSAADLVAEAARSGRWGLRMTARADDAENPPTLIETPPIWIASPGVQVEPGQLVVIHGWVNIPRPITGSVDGLLVVDSLGGEDLALRIDKTAGWREFTLFRVADQSGPISVTLALTGLGEVRLDDISVQLLSPAMMTR
jgi:hypothetical protein